MSDFRKLLLAFAAVTLFAGIASAGPAPALNHTAQPLSARADVTGAIAPDIISIEVNKSEFCSECGAGFQTAPAFIVETSGAFVWNAPQSLNIGSPAITPAPNIAALASGTVVASGNMPNVANTAQTKLSAPSAQATGHLAGTPANLNSNSASNIGSTHSNRTELANSTILNGTNTNNTRFVVVDVGNSAADSSALIVANTGHAFISAGKNATNAPASSPAQVARTAPNAAGINAG